MWKSDSERKRGRRREKRGRGLSSVGSLLKQLPYPRLNQAEARSCVSHLGGRVPSPQATYYPLSPQLSWQGAGAEAEHSV